MKYVCSICGYVYDEADNTPWAELPGTWKCPLCGAARSDFVPEGGAQPAPVQAAARPHGDLRPLNAAETSALCSSLAKGCDKQYLPEQAAAFRRLADWFAAQDPLEAEPSFDWLMGWIGADLEEDFPAANAAAREQGDRGALRSLAWSEKVTRILKSLLERYAQAGGSLPEHTGVYVCTICGFVYVGDELPEVCPVCKVPSRKFERIGG